MKNDQTQNKKWWILIGVSIASFLGCIDFTIVNTALPAIATGLNANVATLQWIMTIFVLALSTFMVIMGRLADVYGRVLILYIGMAIFGMASLMAGLATSIDSLIFYRLLQGMSCAVLYTATGAIVSQIFPSNQKGRAIGILFSINGIGLAVGPVLGGFIVGALNWRWVFLLNVPLIIVSFAILSNKLSLTHRRSQNTKIDYLGMLLLILSVPTFILALIEGDLWGWFSLKTISLFIFSVVMMILFYRAEKRIADPIIQFSLFKNPIFVISIIATFALAFFYCLAFFLMPLYLSTIRSDNAYEIGLMLLPTTAMVALASPFVGKWVDQQGAKAPLLLGFSLFALSAFLQSYFSESDTLVYVLFSFLLMGLAWACVLGPSTTLTLQALPEESGGLAMGAAWTFHNIGGAFGLGLGVAVYHMESIAHHSFIIGYQRSMILLIVVSLVALMAILWGYAIRDSSP